MTKILTNQFINELEAEVKATRRCLEKIGRETFDYKPHEKSMLMGYLTLLVADVPKWIGAAIIDGEINFATWEKYDSTKMNTMEILKLYDENIEGAKKALENTTDEELSGIFYLKAGDQVIMEDSKLNTVSSSLNHWVHHRGQLTVYMRLNNIPVPSIYGPSADDKQF